MKFKASTDLKISFFFVKYNIGSHAVNTISHIFFIKSIRSFLIMKIP